MLTNGQFLSAFVLTLCVLGVLAALAGVTFAAIWVWRLSQPLREWLQHSWIACFIRVTGALLGTAIAHAKRFVACLFAALLALFAHPWQSFIAFLAALGNALRQVPWGICVGVLLAYSFPFLALTIAGVPLQSILGVAVAGTLIGMLCAPFTGWHYKAAGPSKAIGASVLTIVAGAWGSALLMAMLIVMASD